MIKWILVVGVIAAIYFLFIKKKPTITSSKKSTKKSREDDSNEMIECSTCRIYCELDEAILSNNKYYCSDECLEKA